MTRDEKEATLRLHGWYPAMTKRTRGWGCNNAFSRMCGMNAMVLRLSSNFCQEVKMCSLPDQAFNAVYDDIVANEL